MKNIKEILEGLMSDDISGVTPPQPLDIKDINVKLNKVSQDDISKAFAEFNKTINDQVDIPVFLQMVELSKKLSPGFNIKNRVIDAGVHSMMDMSQSELKRIAEQGSDVEKTYIQHKTTIDIINTLAKTPALKKILTNDTSVYIKPGGVVYFVVEGDMTLAAAAELYSDFKKVIDKFPNTSTAFAPEDGETLISIRYKN